MPNKHQKNCVLKFLKNPTLEIAFGYEYSSNYSLSLTFNLRNCYKSKNEKILRSIEDSIDNLISSNIFSQLE